MSSQVAQMLASRLNMQPALLSHVHASVVSSAIKMMSSADDDYEEKQIEKQQATTLAAYGYDGDQYGSSQKPYAFADGIAFIPVTGLLINRFNSCYGWVTGYNYIRSLLTTALADEDVELIIFDCNSPGGEVSGCFELSADIRAARDVKPCVAVVDSSCYSACYALASACTSIYVSPSAGVGSIGVVAMHVSYEKLIEKMGIEVTFIFAGKHKVDGNMFESLPDPVKASIQQRVDTTYDSFAKLVAENRNLKEQAVRDTEARCYTASEGVENGLADLVVTPAMAITEYRAATASRTTLHSTQEDVSMKTNEQKGAVAEKTETKDEAKVEQTASTEPAKQEAAVSGNQDAVISERQRISAIITHDAAKDKSKLANHLALNTNMSVDDAVATLNAASPEKVETKDESAFTAAMNSSSHPNVGADTSEGDLTASQRILRNQGLAQGKV